MQCSDSVLNQCSDNILIHLTVSWCNVLIVSWFNVPIVFWSTWQCPDPMFWVCPDSMFWWYSDLSDSVLIQCSGCVLMQCSDSILIHLTVSWCNKNVNSSDSSSHASAAAGHFLREGRCARGCGQECGRCLQPYLHLWPVCVWGAAAGRVAPGLCAVVRYA